MALGALAACAAPAGDDDVDADDGTGTTVGAWDAESADHESESTHLWIVDRGIDILRKHSDDPVAARAVAMLNDATCRERWQQGLVDADFKAEYNGGRSDLPLHASDAQVGLSGATWESHFYDPDTGENYKHSEATAYTEANAHRDAAIENRVGEADPTACYELGLSLHFFTDLTQPMHAANFTAVDRPAKLHSNLEGYALEIQDRYPLADWSGAPEGELDDYVQQTAKDSKPLFKAGVEAVVKAYRAYRGIHIVTCKKVDVEAWRFIEQQHIDFSYCWKGNADVDEMVGNTLKSAQDHTAKYIYLIGKSVYDAEQASSAAATTDEQVEP